MTLRKEGHHHSLLRCTECRGKKSNTLTQGPNDLKIGPKVRDEDGEDQDPRGRSGPLKGQGLSGSETCTPREMGLG